MMVIISDFECHSFLKAKLESKVGPRRRRTCESEMDRIGTSRINDVARTVFATECPFFDAQDSLDVEIGDRSVRVAYSSFELSDAPREITAIRFDLRLSVAELWIGELHVAKPFRRQGVGSQLVRAAEIVASETGMDVVNVFPLGSSGPFWAKLGYVPHRITAKVLSKPCGCCSSIPSLDDAPLTDHSSRTDTQQRHLP